MTYELVLMPEAEKHLKLWKMSGQKKTLKKIAILFEELRLHLTTGIGHVEQLKGNYTGYCSRLFLLRLPKTIKKVP